MTTTWNFSDSMGVYIPSSGLVASDILAVIGVAVDFTAKKIWFWDSLNNRWNGAASGTQNPATNTGGFDISYITGALFPVFGSYNTFGDSVTINGGSSAFFNTLPAGFSSWDSLAGATTTFSATNKAASITLTNSNFTAAGNGSGGAWRNVQGTNSLSAGKAYFEFIALGLGGTYAFGMMLGVCNSSLSTATFPGADTNSVGYEVDGKIYKTGTNSVTYDPYNAYISANGSVFRSVRGSGFFTSGKRYFEVTITAMSSYFMLMGIANSSFTVITTANNYIGIDAGGNSIGYQPNLGYIYKGNVHTTTIDTAAVGATIGVAVDFTNKKIWFWVSSTNRYNGASVATQDPSNNIGGYDITSVVAASTAPAASFGGALQVDQATGNFGATSFVNTVMPTGFTAWDGSGGSGGSSSPHAKNPMVIT